MNEHGGVGPIRLPVTRRVGGVHLRRFMNGAGELLIEPGRCTIRPNGLLGFIAREQRVEQTSGTIVVRRLRWRPFWVGTRVILTSGEHIDISRRSYEPVRASLAAAGFTVSDH